MTIDTTTTLILFWLLFTMPGYLIIRDWIRGSYPEDDWVPAETFEWTMGQRINFLTISAFAGPVIVIVGIWCHMPQKVVAYFSWATLTKPICNWWKKPVRW